MDVYEAVTSRRAVRAFNGERVPGDVLQRVLSTAARAPSGANLQPWNTFVLTDDALTQLKDRATARAAAGDPGDEPDFPMYPQELPSPYGERRDAAARQRFTALGVRRDDEQARQRAVAANWDCFGAPAALFCYVDRRMGPPQWADVGMYLQTVMLLLRAEGLHSCPQLAWTRYHRSVAEIVSPPVELVLCCGLSVGYEATTSTDVRIDRAPLVDTTTFVREVTDDATPRPPTPWTRR